MANRSVNIYRRVHVQGQHKARFCRVVIGGSNKVHPTKVEYNGKIIEAPVSDFFLGYRSPKQRWERVGNDPKTAHLAAERKRAELASVATGLMESSAGATGRPIQVSLDDARDVYLLDLQRTRSGGTYDLFKQTIEEFVGWMSKEFSSVRYMHEIRRAHMLSYYDVLVKKGLSIRHGESVVVPASPSTAGKKCDRVNQWIRQTLGLKPGCGPIKRTDLPRECFRQEEVEVFTEDELRRFFAACDDEDYLVFALFLHTGLRNKEMSYLTWDDVDLEGGFVTVRPKEGFQVKNGETRDVPVTDDDLLARLAAKKKTSKTKFVFRTGLGGRIRDFLDWAKKIGERAGLKREDVWVHKFRASCATQLANDGLGFLGVQQVLGHKDRKVTDRYLAKSRSMQLRDAIKGVRQQAAGRKLHLVASA